MRLGQMRKRRLWPRLERRGCDIHYSRVALVAHLAQYKAAEVTTPDLTFSRLRFVGTWLVPRDTAVVLLPTPPRVKLIEEANIASFLTSRGIPGSWSGGTR